MDTRLVALDLVLRELGVERNIDTLENRIRLQKAIYLSQAAGVPLGYRFSWYVKGPYSTRLTRDYYFLDVASDDTFTVSDGPELRDDIKSILQNIRPLLSVPQHVDLSVSAWLELVCSLHYLFHTVGKQNAETARAKLRNLKPRLSTFAEFAEQHLREFGLAPVVSARQ